MTHNFQPRAHVLRWSNTYKYYTHLSENPREVLTREEGEAGAVWLWLSTTDWVDERLELLTLTVRWWVRQPPLSTVDGTWWEELCWGLGAVVVGLAGESMWKTNPVLGSAFSDQESSSMLNMHKDIENVHTTAINFVEMRTHSHIPKPTQFISLTCQPLPRQKLREGVWYPIVCVSLRNAMTWVQNFWWSLVCTIVVMWLGTAISLVGHVLKLGTNWWHVIYQTLSMYSS